MADTANKICQGCGAGITAEQIAQRKAGLIQGVLLCPACVEKKRQQALAAQAAQKAAGHVAVAVPAKKAAPTDEADVAISLVDDDEMPTSESRMIRSFAKGSTLGGAHHDDKLQRALTGPTEAATRARTFHGKLTDAGLAHLDDTMNEWLDKNDDVYIKSVTSSIGVFESKTKEPHLFITVFY